MIRAKKGVVITTSDYSRDAIDFVDRIEGKCVVLLNGKQLAQWMIEHDVGVSTIGTCSLKEVSNDFFEEGLGLDLGFAAAHQRPKVANLSRLYQGASTVMVLEASSCLVTLPKSTAVTASWNGPSKPNVIVAELPDADI